MLLSNSNYINDLGTDYNEYGMAGKLVESHITSTQWCEIRCIVAFLDQREGEDQPGKEKCRNG